MYTPARIAHIHIADFVWIKSIDLLRKVIAATSKNNTVQMLIRNLENHISRQTFWNYPCNKNQHTHLAVVWVDFPKTCTYTYAIVILVAPYCAIMRYYRCDTPYRAILLKGGQHSHKMVRYPPLVLNFTQTHPCDTPFCNISRDNCAIPHKNKHEKVLRYYRYKYRAIWKVSLLGL